MGRLTKITPEVLSKLEDAFAYAFSDDLACVYADISPSSLYRYCERNPEFRERKEMLKKRPDIVAQKTVVTSLNDPKYAWEWFKKRNQKESVNSLKVVSKTELSPALAAALKVYNEIRTKEINDEIDAMPDEIPFGRRQDGGIQKRTAPLTGMM